MWPNGLRKSHLLLFGLLLLSLIVWRVALSPAVGGGELTVVVIDVGQGDSIFVRTPSGKTALIDGGGVYGDPDKGEQIGRETIASVLRSYGVNRIDLMVLTHPQEDHCGGLAAIVERFPVGELIEAPFFSRVAIFSYRRLVRSLRDAEVPRRTVQAGQKINFGDGVTAEVLSPPAEVISGTSSDINANSVVLRLVYGKREFLLSGDAGLEAERRMLASRRKLQADVLKVGHHGSRTATSWPFLKAVRPEVAVISCGYKNPYGHPHKDTIKRLRDVGARIYRTDWGGAITIKTDGRSLSVEAYRRRRSSFEGLPFFFGEEYSRLLATDNHIWEVPQCVSQLL